MGNNSAKPDKAGVILFSLLINKMIIPIIEGPLQPMNSQNRYRFYSSPARFSKNQAQKKRSLKTSLIFGSADPESSGEVAT